MGLKKRHLTTLLVGLLLFIAANAQNSARDQRLISYARNVDISKLDPKLRKQRLDSWIRSLIGNTKQDWRIEDCAARTGNSSYDADPAICGKMFSKLADGRELKIWIAIASHKTGTKAPPTLWLAYFGVPGQEKPAPKLSDLPALIKGVVAHQSVPE